MTDNAEEATGDQDAIGPVESGRNGSARRAANGGTPAGRGPSKAAGHRRALAAIAALVLVVLVAGGWLYSTWRAGERPLVDVPAGQPVTIVVPAGSTTVRIGQILAEHGVVATVRGFRDRVTEAGAGESLLAGTYELRTGMGYEAAIASLTAGPQVVYVKVTIPEGWTVDQIAARLEEQVGIPAKEFLEVAGGGAAQFAVDHPAVEGAYRGSLEGFLFPKTYQVKEDATARDVIQMMLNQFDKEIATVDLARASQKGISLPELVTMASLIERETKVAKERPMVSSVIYNRLARNMRLGIDATIEYVIKERKVRLTYEDLNLDSPYNTYRHAGLPPGPIASPGLASLKAAAAPADTDYLYYVLTGKDGSHTFARDADEFAKAKAKSKEVFGE